MDIGRNVFLHSNEMSFSRFLWLSLQVNLDASFFGSLLFGSIFLDSSQKVITAFAMSDMLNSDVDSLLNESVSYPLVDQHTNGRFGDIENHSSATSIARLTTFQLLLPVIEFMRHAFVHRAIHLDVHNIANFVGFQICAELDGTVFSEVPRKHMARSCAIPKRMRHGFLWSC